MHPLWLPLWFPLWIQQTPSNFPTCRRLYHQNQEAEPTYLYLDFWDSRLVKHKIKLEHTHNPRGSLHPCLANRTLLEFVWSLLQDDHGRCAFGPYSPTYPACTHASSLRSQEKASLPGLGGKCRALPLLCARYLVRLCPQAEPDLAQPSLVIWQLWNLDHVSEPSFLLLGDGSSKNTPKCYDEECPAYSRCQ